ncbi:hypothetical protein [Catelliglobosispora koreensis]|uniref:hypothetical protein n=1 Tax=Catelliglobosispora koreensis TaxID=129052 RepID=UPI00037F2935|nr:hypothetical protein [Catelliglobosispora koreensis]
MSTNAAIPAQAPPPLIREWHAMTRDEQATEWQALVEWVIWIHDLYELSREERLPLCWPNHPGLVEELRALKAWRQVIYTAPENATAGHTARSWHGELRQTIAACAGFWAPSCRSGHTDAALLTDLPGEHPRAWLETGPPLMASAPAPTTAPSATAEGGLGMSASAMAAALEAGRAVVHSSSLPIYAQLDGTWWTRTPDDTWLPCTDPQHQAHLDSTAAAMRAADTQLDELRPE